MNKKLIIFDLDGTLADTSPGILSCHKYANKAMGRSIPTDRELDGIIGGPLLKTYMERFLFSKKEAQKAVSIYREHYSLCEYLGVKKYANMDTTLQELKHKGYKLAVATLKEENLAKKVLEVINLDGFFDVIHGMDKDDKLTKSDLLFLCMKELNFEKAETVLIGDSIHDAIGAEQAGIDFIAVTYGFGFKTEKELCPINHIAVCKEPIELLKVLN